VRLVAVMRKQRIRAAFTTFFVLALAAAVTLYALAATAEDAASPKLPPRTPIASPGDPDTRASLPLTAMMAAHQKANMRDHLAAVQEIVAALAANDMPAVEKAARRIGYSDSMAQMCRHMGAGAPGFTDLALSFHRTADTIAAAAERGDRQAATAALAATLSTCVGCHAAYKQEVVDEATWRRLTDGSAR
jgi:cytochrome c556